MDDQAYYKAVTPEPWTILGLRMHPLSLGHIHLLHRFESRFVDPDGTPGVSDLILACFICSRSYRDVLEAMEDERLERFLSTWHDRLTRPTWLHRLGFRNPVAIDWSAKIRSFIQYMKEGSTYPDFSLPERAAESFTCPLPLLVRAYLLKETGIPENELMDRPWGLCLWDFVTLRSFDGTVKLTDSEAVQEAYEIAQRLAETLEKRNGSRTKSQS